MANGPVPSYVAPIAPSKTYSDAITEGTKTLGPLLAQNARFRINRDNQRRKDKNERLKQLKGYDVSNWSDNHVKAYDMFISETRKAIANDDPMLSVYIDNAIRYGDKFDAFSKEQQDARTRQEQGITDPGSLDTDDLVFTGNEESLKDNDRLRDLGGIVLDDTFRIENGVMISEYLDAQGNPIGSAGDVFEAPGLDGNYYDLDFEPRSDLLPENFAEQFRASVNDLVSSNVSPKEAKERTRLAMERRYDESKSAQATTNKIYSDLDSDLIDLRNKYIDESLNYLGFERLASRSGGTSSDLAVDVIENRTSATITQLDLDAYPDLARDLGAITGDEVGPNLEVKGQSYVLNELEKGKGVELPNREFDPLYEPTDYDDKSKIQFKKSPVIDEKIRTIEVYPSAGILVLRGGTQGEYPLNYKTPTESNAVVLEQLRQEINAAYEGELTLDQLLDPDRAARNVTSDQQQREEKPEAVSQAPVNEDPLGIR